MNLQRLVEMANDIGAFFAAEPDREEAVAGVLGHLQKFWDPRMRRAIGAYLAEGGEGLKEPARSAVALLIEAEKRDS